MGRLKGQLQSALHDKLISQGMEVVEVHILSILFSPIVRRSY